MDDGFVPGGVFGFVFGASLAALIIFSLSTPVTEGDIERGWFSFQGRAYVVAPANLKAVPK